MGKKEKKSKKKKSHKRSRSYSSSSTSDDGCSSKTDLQSVSSTSDRPSDEKILKRDEWMDLAGSLTSSCFSRKKDKKTDVSSTSSAITEKPGQSSRELNPYWKDGGTGLPEVCQESKSRPLLDVTWLKKSLRRAEEQAVEEGKTLEEVAATRWGSLEVIKAQIAEAEQRDGKCHKLNHGRDKMYHKERYRSFRKPNDNADVYTRGSNKLTSSATRHWQKQKKEEIVLEHKSQNSEKQNERVDNSTVERKSESLVLSEAEMNKLGAKIVKAEIMGNEDLANQLKQQLEEARKHASARKSDTSNSETVILTKMDQQGVERPLIPRDQIKHSSKHSRKKISETHSSGERVRYFADDDKYSLQEMFQREKGRSASDEDAMLAKMASRSKDLDDLFEQQISQKGFSGKQDDRDRMSAIKEHKNMSRSLDSCEWCIDSKYMFKHMIVTMDSMICLSLPTCNSLVDGHCILTPIQHVPCQVQLDEDVWSKLQEYKKTLVNMFRDRKMSPIFFEVFKGHRKFPHMQLQCIPLPLEAASEARMYFKKALLECEAEWSVNKKVVDLSQKNVRQAIPKGLPYFAVNFENEGGYGHVIEDVQMFPQNFAQEIVGGMLNLDHTLWRKPKREKFDQQKAKVLEFIKIWKRYDPNSTTS